MRRPAYRDLPEIAPGYRHAWHVTVDGDPRVGARGPTPEQIVAATRLVRRGAVFNVDLPFGRFPAGFLGRAPLKHHEEITHYGRDDRIDDFSLQSSTQWDGLRHIRFRGHGYFGGLTDAELDRGDDLGIDHVADHGIVGRAVLVDVAEHWTAQGRDWSPSARTVIGVGDLTAALEREGTSVGDGDVLLLRTGWLDWSLNRAPGEYLGAASVESAECVGLDAGEEMAEWIWDSGLIAVASDTAALEAMPIRARAEGFLHHRLIPLLGIMIGELWELDLLAADCRRDGIYEGLLVSSPLNVPRAAGSPANAYVLK